MENITKVLSELQRKVKVPKNQRNNFGNYNYRSCEDILEAVKPHLPEGVVIVITDKIVKLGERYYVKAKATISDGKEEIHTVAYARESQEKRGMDLAQITGATSSYARKYALNGLLMIDDVRDADTQDNTEKAVAKPKDARKDKIKELLLDLGHEPKTVKEANDIVLQLTEAEFKLENFDDIISKLSILVDEKDAKLEQ